MASSGMSPWRPRPVTAVTTAVIVVLALVITIIAVRSPGYAVSDVDANNGGVWVLNTSKGMVGRINVDAQEFDARLQADSTDDVLQSDSTVFTRTHRGTERVNVAALRLEGQIELGGEDRLVVGGDRVALLRSDGRLWILTADQMAAFDPTATEPTATIKGGDAEVTVTDDGTALVLDGRSVRVFPRSLTAPKVEEADAIDLGTEVSGSDQLDLTAVGSTPVVLDRGTGELRIGEDASTVDLADAGVPDPGTAVLQQVSAGGDGVVLATNDSLFDVPLAGGDPRRLKGAGSGTPVPPVQAAGCTYGAWTGSNTYLSACGDSDPSTGTIERAAPDARLALRVNHELVVLNDQDTGLSWMIADAMQIVDQWEVKTELQKKEVEEKKKETLTSSVTNVAPDQRDENRPPVANPDALGVRAGTSVVLPVTENDTDPDGDILVVSPLAQPPTGQVTPIQGGTALQIDVAPDATGTATFSYQADDGREGTAVAEVTLEVHGPERNEGPQPIDGRVPRLSIAQGAAITFNAAPHFRDPDGDAFYLANATVEGEDDLVTFRPDGLVTFNDAGLTTGDKPVRLTFRDARGASSEAQLIFAVEPGVELPPITTPDHVQMVAGRTMQVEPLINDLNPGGGDLELAFVGQADGLTVTSDLEAGTVDVRGDVPGARYLTYQAGAGAETVQGLIRVDILPPTSEAMNPVAVDDMALVTSGRSTLVDPIANDVDPTGGVLVVNSAVADPSTGLVLTVLDHHLLRIEADPAAPIGDAPVEVPYTVANATGSVTGTVRVMVVPPDTQFANPVAVPDRATVRAGDVVKVPVLDNDRSPSSSQLTLTSVDPSGLGDAAGVEIVEDQARVSARAGTSGELTFGYTTTDETGRTGSSTVTVRIVPEGDPNDAPVPENSEARTVSGSTARIPIRTSGIDPDGDSVLLTGITGDPPASGRVTRSTGEYIEYQAYDGASGTDTITYQVMDAQGAVGTAQVTVGIAEAPQENLPPVTRADSIQVRPSRDLQLHVLANDVDPEGTPLRIDRSLTTSDEALVLDPPVDEERIPSLDTTSPAEPGAYSVSYAASDGQLSAPGAATVLVSEDAELRPPLARDDYVDATDVTDQSTDTVPVDVLANDEDPDGSVANLVPVLEGAPEGTEVQPDGTVNVPKGDHQQRIRYTITDQDGAASSAFIWVPGRDSQIPRWIGPPVQARAGEPVDIDLRDDDNVRVRAGADGATVVDATSARSGHGDGSDLVAGPHALRYTPAADYAGEDTVSVQVTDSDDPSDPEGAQGTLQIPVEVTSEENLPPTVQGAAVQVPKGEAAVPIDLALGAQDPENKPLTFAIGETPQVPGVTVGHRGSTVLTVEAAPDAVQDQTLEIPFTVSDGVNEPVPALVRVSIVGSQRLPAQLGADTAVVDVGKETVVDVLANDYNPFPDTPLTLESAATAVGGVDAVPRGDQVVLSARPGFHGTATVTYRVKDATGEDARAVTGTISAEVRDVPDAPSAPRIVEEGDSSVTLTFTAGADNGAPITSYAVRSASGPPASSDCASTTCTITGLTNGAEYSFSVVAVNVVGESPPSTASAVARPDVRPDPPAAPAATRDDGQLSVAWSAPTNRGSAITGYELQISGPGGIGEAQQLGAGTRTFTWTGLTNGVDYRFRVRASNGAKDASDWSEWSAAEHPAGLPKQAAGTPRATRINTNYGKAVTVEFPAMSTDEANGEPIRQYVVRSSGGQERSVDAGKTSVTFDELDPNTDYTFTYVGVNSVGRGPTASKGSNAVLPFSVPAAPGGVTAAPNPADTNQKVLVTWKAADARGTTLTGYKITWEGGSKTVGAGETSTVVGGLTNGKSYTFKVQADNGNPGGQSELSASATARPFTNPGKPQVSGRAGSCPTSSTCTAVFTASGNGDGGAPPLKLEYQVDGAGGWKAYSGAVTVDGTSGQSHSMEVRATNGENRTATGSATADAAKSEPKITSSNAESFGRHVRVDNCQSDYCRVVQVRIGNLEPGKSYKLNLRNTDANNNDSGPWAVETFTANSQGEVNYNQNSSEWVYGYNDRPLSIYVDGKKVGEVMNPG